MRDEFIINPAEFRASARASASPLDVHLLRRQAVFVIGLCWLAGWPGLWKYARDYTKDARVLCAFFIYICSQLTLSRIAYGTTIDPNSQTENIFFSSIHCADPSSSSSLHS